MTFWARTAGPLLYAHRGASAERPENTLGAFERALELGADVLELDVHPSRDGVFVVSHDPSGARSCGVPRRIADCSWPELREWDAGLVFVDAQGGRPFAGSGVRLSRFDDVLDAFPDVPFNVDVKAARGPEIASLIGLIRERRAEERVLLTSFSWRTVRRIERAGYRGALGLSQIDVVGLRFAPEPVFLLLPLPGVRAQIPTHSGRIDLSHARFIDKCHRLGRRVDYWVVNQPQECARLLDNGADGIISDDVAAIAGFFRTAARTEAWRLRHPQTATSRETSAPGD
jgi:glycerophosphoryl diester phosphodiesterase